MADIETATVAPPQLAPPARWSAAATATWALSCFLSLASQVVICLFLSASLTCSLTNGARIATRWVFGASSPQAAAFVEELFIMTIYAVLLIAAVAFVLAMALFLHCFVMAQLLRRRWRREGREVIHEWDEEREICALLTSSYVDG